jgi:hypothetical protein
MLDFDLVLQEAEAVLDNHYAAWQQGSSRRVQVYETPQRPPRAQQATSALPGVNGAGRQLLGQGAAKVAPARSAPVKPLDIGEAVTNAFLFVILTVLSDRLARRGPR